MSRKPHLIPCPIGDLRPHPSYARHGLSVDACKLSALAERADRAFCEPISITYDRIVIDGYARWELAKRTGRGDDETTRRVQNLVEERRKLTAERTAQSNRLTSYLKIYFPQIVQWFEKLDMPLVCDLLDRWPTLEELQKVSPEELRMFFCQHHCHRGLRERRILAIGGAIPAKGDRAVIEAKSAVVKVIVQLIRSLLCAAIMLRGGERW